MVIVNTRVDPSTVRRGVGPAGARAEPPSVATRAIIHVKCLSDSRVSIPERSRYFMVVFSVDQESRESNKGQERGW